MGIIAKRQDSLPFPLLSLGTANWRLFWPAFTPPHFLVGGPGRQTNGTTGGGVEKEDAGNMKLIGASTSGWHQTQCCTPLYIDSTSSVVLLQTLWTHTLISAPLVTAENQCGWHCSRNGRRGRFRRTTRCAMTRGCCLHRGTKPSLWFLPPFPHHEASANFPALGTKKCTWPG